MDSQMAHPGPLPQAAAPQAGRMPLRRIGQLVRPAWIAAILFVCLGLGLTILALRGGADAGFGRAEEFLGELEQTDAQWTASILSVQLGLSQNYDVVAAPVYAMWAGRDALREASAPLPLSREERARLVDLERRLTGAATEKAELAGRIASQRAVLSNSTRFLPAATADLLNGLADPAVAAETAAEVRDRVVRIAGGVATSLFQQGAERRTDVDADIEELGRLTASLPGLVAERAQVFAQHAALIISRRQLGDELLTRLEAVPTRRLLEELRSTYAQARAGLAQGQRGYRLAAIGLAVLLVALIAYLGWELRRNYHQIARSNQQLQHDNVETQALLVQSAKMSALGQMVAGIAHEINTPLAYLKATLSLLQELLQNSLREAGSERRLGEMLREPAKDGSEPTLFGDIETLLSDGLHGAERISELVRSLRNFSRLDQTQQGLYPVVELIDGALTMSTYQLKHVADVDRAYEQVPNIRCSPSQISQVLLNLISNAAHAMSGRDRRGLIRIAVSREDEGHVRVDVRDNGTGIPPEVLPRIFDPFFTMKKVGEGTGLGLSICYRIVSNHGGKLLVRSELGVGTTFSLILPTDMGAAPASGARASKAGTAVNA